MSILCTFFVVTELILRAVVYALYFFLNSNRIGFKSGVPEYKMRTVVNANSASSHSRRVTVEPRFAILVFTHDGFALRLYKSSSAHPIEQVLVVLNMYFLL